MNRLMRCSKGRTFVGQIERSFAFVGYHFTPTGPKVAKKTMRTSSKGRLGFMLSPPDNLLAIADEVIK